MSCCTLEKKQKSVSSEKQLKELRKYFDLVEVEDLENYRTLTLSNIVKNRDTVIQYEVWLQVKIAYVSGNYRYSENKFLESVCTEILKWKDKLLFFDKKKKGVQLSLFDDEPSEDEPLEKYSFFELCPLNGDTYGTYHDMDYRKYLPKSNKEMIELIKNAIVKGTSSEKGYGRFNDFWWDDEYSYMTRDGALSDYEIISRVKSLIRLYLVPYHRDRRVSVDLSFNPTVVEAKTDYRFWFDGKKINSCGHHWYEEKHLLTYELYNSEFIAWLREYFNIPCKEMLSDEDMLKRKVFETLQFILSYKKDEYDLFEKVRTFDSWKSFKKDFMGSLKNNNLNFIGGSSGYCIDGFSSSINGNEKIAKLVITQDIYARKLADRNIDDLDRDDFNKNKVIVFDVEGDEIFKLAYEFILTDLAESL